MKNEGKRKSTKQWISDHAVELLVGCIAFAGLCILIYLERDALGKLILRKKTVKLSIPNSSVPNELTLFDVSQAAGKTLETSPSAISAIEETEVRGFVRNLHNGWVHSPEKAAEALEYGITLEPGQTWVNSFTRTYHRAAL